MPREVDALEPVPAERLYSPRQLSAEGLMCFRRLVARDHGAQLGHHHTRLGVRVERKYPALDEGVVALAGDRTLLVDLRPHPAGPEVGIGHRRNWHIILQAKVGYPPPR